LRRENKSLRVQLGNEFKSLACQEKTEKLAMVQSELEQTKLFRLSWAVDSKASADTLQMSPMYTSLIGKANIELMIKVGWYKWLNLLHKKKGKTLQLQQEAVNSNSRGCAFIRQKKDAFEGEAPPKVCVAR
jgi:hypothetical protein